MKNEIRSKWRRRGPRNGQALLMVSLSVPVLFGLLGLAVDVGWTYWRQEACYAAAQAAASAAVIAAKANIGNDCGTGTTNVTCQSRTACSGTLSATKPLDVGCMYASANGFVNGGNSGRQTVSVSAGTNGSPVSGPSAQYWVNYTVTEQIPTLFTAVLGKSAFTAAASASAGSYGGGGGCIYVLNPTMDGGINMSDGTLSSNCGIYVNSNNAKAIDTSNGHISTTGSARTYVVGKCNNDTGCNEVTPAAVEGSSTITDPFAGLAAPSTTGMTTYGAVNVNGGTTTIQPGIYTGLITANNGTLKVSPGTYVLQAGFNINGATVVEAATGGELFYITGGQFKITSGSVTLNAQTSGSYQGILLWEPAANTNAVIMTDGSLTATGALYAKAAQLQITDGNFTNTTIVVDNIRISNGTAGANLHGISNTQFTGAKVYLVQ
jgi:Flp pilus assembly protein TadG